MDLFYSLAFLVLALGIGGLLGKHLRNQQKAGTLLGFLGPLGWAFVLLLNDRRLRCPECRSVVDPEATRCARCGARFSAQVTSSAPPRPAPPAEQISRSAVTAPSGPSRTLVPPRGRPTALGPVGSILALVGALILGIGCLLPLVQFPIVGAVSLYQSGSTEQTLALVAFAGLTFLAALLRSPRVVWIPGALVAAVGLYRALAFKYAMGGLLASTSAKASEGGFADLLVSGLSQIASQRTGIAWGAYVLLLGALLPVVSAATATPVVRHFLARGHPLRAGSEDLGRDQVAWTAAAVALAVAVVGLAVGSLRLAAYLGERSARLEAAAEKKIEETVRQQREALARARQAHLEEIRREERRRADVARQVTYEALLRRQQYEAEQQADRHMLDAEARARIVAEIEQRREADSAARKKRLAPWVQTFWPAVHRLARDSQALANEILQSRYSPRAKCRGVAQVTEDLAARGAVTIDDPEFRGYLTTCFNAYRALASTCGGPPGETRRMADFAAATNQSLQRERQQLGLK